MGAAAGSPGGAHTLGKSETGSGAGPCGQGLGCPTGNAGLGPAGGGATVRETSAVGGLKQRLHFVNRAGPLVLSYMYLLVCFYLSPLPLATMLQRCGLGWALGPSHQKLVPRSLRWAAVREYSGLGLALGALLS